MVLLFTQTSKKLNTKKYFYKIAITFIANYFPYVSFTKSYDRSKKHSRKVLKLDHCGFNFPC